MPNESWAAPEFWAEASGQPSEGAVFGALLALRGAGFSDDEVVALMKPAGITPDPDTVGLTVLGWVEVEDFSRRRWLYEHAALFGDERAWVA